ncbi:hypothetical protein Tco_1206888 [Tanacetum coccineum]
MKSLQSSSRVSIVPSLSSSNHVFCFPNSEEFVNVFMRIRFGSTIELVFFDKGQLVTFDSKFICGFRNSDCETRCGATTWSTAHMDSSSLDRNFEEYQESDESS